jgi:hypothetical protein
MISMLPGTSLGQWHSPLDIWPFAMDGTHRVLSDFRFRLRLRFRLTAEVHCPSHDFDAAWYLPRPLVIAGTHRVLSGSDSSSHPHVTSHMSHATTARPTSDISHATWDPSSPNPLTCHASHMAWDPSPALSVPGSVVPHPWTESNTDPIAHPPGLTPASRDAPPAPQAINLRMDWCRCKGWKPLP